MTAAVRAIGRATACLVFLAFWGVLNLLTLPFHRHGARRERWRRRVLGGGCRGVLRILGIEVTIEGELPRGAGILVTNHLGYVDVLVLGSVLDVVFVSRDDVAHWPVIGPFARASGTVFIDRDRKRQLPGVVEEMRSWNARGTRVVFFPEGTSGRGDVVMPFRSSLFQVAVTAGAVVHAGALHYATDPPDAPPEHAVCWWGDTDFGPHAWRLLRLRRVRARVSFSPEEIEPTDRKTMARRAQQAVESVFTPSAPPVEETVDPA